MKSNDMFDQFKDIVEMREYANAQYNTIVTQSKKITQLEEEIRHMKRLLAEATPLLPVSTDQSALHVNDEEFIARIEIKKLRDVSMARELTMEETRKLEVYAKLLHQLNNVPKKLIIDTKKMSADTLLASLDNAEDEK